MSCPLPLPPLYLPVTSRSLELVEFVDRAAAAAQVQASLSTRGLISSYGQVWLTLDIACTSSTINISVHGLATDSRLSPGQVASGKWQV